MSFQQVDKKDLNYTEIKNGQKWSMDAGVYLMLFPNGMKYIGKSNHLGKRLISHVSAFKKGNDWHGKAKDCFCPIKNPTFYQMWESFVQNVEYYIYTVPAGEEDKLEEHYLKQIAFRFNQKMYYNTKYPEISVEEWIEYEFGGV